MPSKKMFMYCEKCNKKLIERLPNGLFKFIFGKDRNRKGNPPVQLLVFGSIRIRCFRKLRVEDKVEECGCWNTFNFFPDKRITNQLLAEEKAISDQR